LFNGGKFRPSKRQGEDTTVKSETYLIGISSLVPLAWDIYFSGATFCIIAKGSGVVGEE
jgi:hypothetical protein